MKKNTFSATILLAAMSLTQTAWGQGMKDVMGDDFLIGTAVNVDQQDGKEPQAVDIVRTHFNVVTPENCMKSEKLQPERDRYDFRDTDRFVAFAQDNDLAIIGHCLVWHSQAPQWAFKHDDGSRYTREEMIDRLRTYIYTVAGRYRGKIHGWDVINEAFNDDGSYRETEFYKYIGPEYFELAFRFAHEADPDAELYYNDYNMATPAKRAAVCRMVKDLKRKGCRIDAVGMQSHNGYNYPDLEEWEKTIDSLAACGVKVIVSELDLNMLPMPKSFSGADVDAKFAYDKKMNPYRKGLDKKGEQLFEERYLAIFDIIYRHRRQINRVTLWGVSDNNTWLNDWPIKGRTNHSLLFDRNYKAKPVVGKIMEQFE